MGDWLERLDEVIGQLQVGQQQLDRLQEEKVVGEIILAEVIATGQQPEDVVIANGGDISAGMERVAEGRGVVFGGHGR